MKPIKPQNIIKHGANVTKGFHRWLSKDDIEAATLELHKDDPLKMDGGSKQLLLDAMGMLHKRSHCIEHGYELCGEEEDEEEEE